MTINDRNRLAFSYTSHDVRNKRFIYKNFNKSSSYSSNFSDSTFESSSFVGSKFKFCGMYGAIFNKCLIRGTLFRKCNLEAAIFTDCIIAASSFDRTKLKNSRFINCKIIGSTNLKGFLPAECFENTEFLSEYPSEDAFSDELITVIKNLRSNPFIRKSTVLHRKKDKLDTISLKLLVDEFGDNTLTLKLPAATLLINNEFHTLTYIQSVLRKV